VTSATCATTVLKRLVHRDAAAAPVADSRRHQRQRPVGLGRRHLEDALVARGLGEQRAAKLEGILARRRGELVEEGLGGERRVSRATERHHCTGTPIFGECSSTPRLGIA